MGYCELLRGKVAPSTYKDIALGLLFLKFISYWYDQRRAEIQEKNKNATEKERNYLLNLKDSYTSKGVFFLKEGDKWDDLTRVVSSEKNIAIKIDNTKMIANPIPKTFNPIIKHPDLFFSSFFKELQLL